jgi:hypothetical protein
MATQMEVDFYQGLTVVVAVVQEVLAAMVSTPEHPMQELRVQEARGNHQQLVARL